MKLTWASALLLITIFTLSGCGGGNDRPRLAALVELDSSAAEGEPGNTESQVIEIIEQRVRALGGSGFDSTARLTEPWKIHFEFSALDADTARAVFNTGFLEFRQPTRNDRGEIVCQMADGSEFNVESGSMTEGLDEAGKKEAQCVGAAGETGAVVWEPAMATDSEGDLRQLTGAHLKPITTQVVTEPGQCVPACVLLEFNNEGALLFEKITTRLVNYPLGFFLDEELLGAPTVATVISNGQTIVTGMTEQEAEILSAQLNSGPLPVPVKLISIEEAP